MYTITKNLRKSIKKIKQTPYRIQVEYTSMQIYFIYRLRNDFNQSQVPNNITPATQHKSTLAKTCFLGDVPQLEEKQSAHRIPGGSPPSSARFEMKISIVFASVVSRYQRGCSSSVYSSST